MLLGSLNSSIAAHLNPDGDARKRAHPHPQKIIHGIRSHVYPGSTQSARALTFLANPGITYASVDKPGEPHFERGHPKFYVEEAEEAIRAVRCEMPRVYLVGESLSRGEGSIAECESALIVSLQSWKRILT